ncbi:MAG TPA: hypothetical protein VGC13_32450 [Longimicrobium sp.]|jgi:hypothetical protein|uniref:hypothetical protein n=1 Tax=Longimicrobium sp. TaxID=2029185 RepID=UPI002EDB313C
MSHSRSLVSVLGAAMFAGAVSFGAVQAFASPSAPASVGSCDLMACYQGCVARYGEGVQARCTTWGGCQCIL